MLKTIQQLFERDLSLNQQVQVLGELSLRPLSGQSLFEISMYIRSRSTNFSLGVAAVDLCGTGGDGFSTFNISTAASLVLASSGLVIAKHGNRAVSGRSGSFDLIENLGLPSATSESQAIELISQFNLAYLFAPDFYPLLKKIGMARKAFGKKTIFNLLGPLLNPARVHRQVVGVYSPQVIEPVAEALLRMGHDRFSVFCGEADSPGIYFDEVSGSGPTQCLSLVEGKLKSATLAPRDFGISRVEMRDLKVASVGESAQFLMEVLYGERGAATSMVVANAAFADWVLGESNSLDESIERVESHVFSKQPLNLLRKLQGFRGVKPPHESIA